MSRATATLPKSERLHSRKAIQQLFRTGKWYRGAPCLHTIYQIKKGSLPHQALFVVPSRQVRKAVWRNTIKRHMREAFRRNKQNLPVASGQYLVMGFIYKGKAPLIASHALRQALIHTLQQLSKQVKPR